MSQRATWNRIAQWAAVLACDLTLKRYYATASADELRWVLAPTTALVELVSGVSFEFESQAGYLSRERGFLIASSCAGVNFLLTAFMLLTLRKLVYARSKCLAWSFIPTAALIAYLVTLVANTARIAVALWLQQVPVALDWLNPHQLHRLAGIITYFGFLLLLYVVSETLNTEWASRLFRQLSLPLLVYYATNLGVPLVNSGSRQGADFWEHALFVLLVPLLLILPLAVFCLAARREATQ
jgi:exosortase K